MFLFLAPGHDIKELFEHLCCFAVILLVTARISDSTCSSLLACFPQSVYSLSEVKRGLPPDPVGRIRCSLLPGRRTVVKTFQVKLSGRNIQLTAFLIGVSLDLLSL